MDAMKSEQAAATLRCAECGGVIGVYEPLVHVFGGIAHKTSRAADPALAHAEAGHCYHLDCSSLDGAGLISVE
jgi:hypothetical protein